MRLQQQRPAGDSSAPSSSGALLKWVGAATAVISLILGARQLITIATDRGQRTRESAEFTALARQQAGRGEFSEAGAASTAPRSARARRTPKRHDSTLHSGGCRTAGRVPNQPFSRITDAVVPALDRALLNAQHPRRADILAHLGWATFLKWRETGAAIRRRCTTGAGD
jgi:hypothetical protein